MLLIKWISLNVAKWILYVEIILNECYYDRLTSCMRTDLITAFSLAGAEVQSTNMHLPHTYTHSAPDGPVTVQGHSLRPITFRVKVA